MTAVCAKINNNVLYFGCDHFALHEAYLSKNNNTVKTSLDFFFDQLTNHLSSLSKIIIDVRNNPGGNVEDLNFLIGHFIAKPLFFGNTRYKTGLGKYNYTPWTETDIQPHSKAKDPPIPIIVLGDNFTISLAEAVVMAIREMPKGHFIGERTWGATGPVASGELYYGGSFTMAGFMNVSESSAEFKYYDGKIYEGLGFSPDIPIGFNLNTLNLGKDLVLEAAINK